MAEALKIPNQVVDSDWKDDIDFETFKNESKYENKSEIPADAELIDKKQVKHETAARAKNKKVGRVAFFSLKDDKLAKAA